MDLTTIAAIAALIGAAALGYYYLGSFLAGAGYQPTFRAVVARMLDLAEVGPSDRVIDPGAGTGAILFAAARRGASVTGIEIEPIRVSVLRLRRRLSPFPERIRILWQNVFRAQYDSATVITVFLWPEAMRRLRPIWERELAPGTRVVSHWHEMPGWVPRATDNDERLFLYVWPEAGQSVASRAL